MTLSSGFKSFHLSVLFHAALIVIVSLSISSNENIVPDENRRLISMNLGSFGSIKEAGLKAAPKKAAVLKGEKIVESTTSKKSLSLNSSESVASTDSTGSGNTTGNASGVGSGSGSGSGTGDSQSFSSSIVNFREPIYPKMALRRGLEGSLRVRIKINSEGIPVETIVLKSSGFEMLDQAALAAIKNWVFVKRENGSFYFVEKNIVFELNK